MSTPEIKLQTSVILSERGRILSTREPGAMPGPLFLLIRNQTSCAWAVRTDVPADIADALDRLAREEPPSSYLRAEPLHAARYLELVRLTTAGGEPVTGGGPGFTFPASLPEPGAVATIDDEALLQRHFKGWIPGEIIEGRAPVLAVVDDGYPVSVCFCARRSDTAAEAGLETAAAFRGRGLAPRVTAAWARAIRASGRLPLYSTAWTNHASLAVARRLGLIAYASTWSITT